MKPTKTSIVLTSKGVRFGLPRGWIAYAKVVPQGGRLVVGSLEITVPPDKRIPRGGLIHDDLRRVPLGQAGPFLQARARHWDEHLDSPLERKVVETLGLGGIPLHVAAGGSGRRSRPRRRSGRDDQYYARLASDYLSLVEHGSRRPTADLAAHRKMTPEQARDQVHEARERGILSPGRPGQHGGSLLTYGRSLLSKVKGR